MSNPRHVYTWDSEACEVVAVEVRWPAAAGLIVVPAPVTGWSDTVLNDGAEWVANGRRFYESRIEATHARSRELDRIPGGGPAHERVAILAAAIREHVAAHERQRVLDHLLREGDRDV